MTGKRKAKLGRNTVDREQLRKAKRAFTARQDGRARQDGPRPIKMGTVQINTKPGMATIGRPAASDGDHPGTGDRCPSDHPGRST